MINTEHHAIHTVNTCYERHRPALPAMILLPLLLEGGKTSCLVSIKIALELQDRPALPESYDWQQNPFQAAQKSIADQPHQPFAYSH